MDAVRNSKELDGNWSKAEARGFDCNRFATLIRNSTSGQAAGGYWRLWYVSDDVSRTYAFRL